MLHVSIQNVQYYTTINKNVQRLFAGIQRVGRAGLGAINRLQPFKCRLFVHRNTLVYRLEKIKKLTGLDLREFDDAIVFKVALMVKKYLSNNPAKY